MPLMMTPETTAMDWNALADRVLSGGEVTRAEAFSILTAADDDVPALVAAAYRLRLKHFGHKVHFYYLKNAKSGLCPEDCGYCSQNIDSTAEIPRYPMLNERKLMEGAAVAASLQARTYCIVASGRGPSNREVEHVAQVVKKIKDEHGLHICCCLGLLTPEQAKTLKEAGVDRINHNLNTSRRYYEQICSTHSFEDRLATLRTVREAGLELCCGLIAGMGEEHADLIDVAMELRGMKVESIPVNFLNSIEGTQLEHVRELNPRYCLKVLCMLRFVIPAVELRIAGGREIHLRSLQAMGLYVANSLFVSDYLTTKGQPPELDFQMVEDLGFEIITGDHESHRLWKERRQAETSRVAEACGASCST
jgi:biotin synthase